MKSFKPLSGHSIPAVGIGTRKSGGEQEQSYRNPLSKSCTLSIPLKGCKLLKGQDIKRANYAVSVTRYMRHHDLYLSLILILILSIFILIFILISLIFNKLSSIFDDTTLFFIVISVIPIYFFLICIFSTFWTPLEEDNYFWYKLKLSERDALQELTDKLSAAKVHDDSTMWGIRLLGIKGEVILLKFLRASNFRAADAHQMLLKCLSWRKMSGIDKILENDLGFKELEGVVAYMHGFDREGRHPVCYNAFGVFKDKNMYERIYGDKEKFKKFLRWRVQVLERGIQHLDFKPGGVNSIIHVVDLKHMPKKELRVASLLRNFYPEMVSKKIFINVPWSFSMLYTMISPFILSRRTRNKIVISKEGNVAKTLYKFMRPENIPVQYGGLSRPSDVHGGPQLPARELPLDGGEKVIIEIEDFEGGATIKWDIVVGGWELIYSAEFLPKAEASNYTIAVDKPRKIAANKGAIHNSFTTKEPGKMVLTVDNSASRKQKVAAYRLFVRDSSPGAAYTTPKSERHVKHW